MTEERPGAEKHTFIITTFALRIILDVNYADRLSFKTNLYCFRLHVYIDLIAYIAKYVPALLIIKSLSFHSDCRYYMKIEIRFNFTDRRT